MTTFQFAAFHRMLDSVLIIRTSTLGDFTLASCLLVGGIEKSLGDEVSASFFLLTASRGH